MVAGGSGPRAETLPPYLRIAEASRALHSYELVWHDDRGGDDKDDHGGCETKGKDEGDDDDKDKDDNKDDDDDSDEAGAENAVHISQQGRNTGNSYNQAWTETSTSEDCDTPLNDQISPRANEVGQRRIGSSPQAPPKLIDDQENTAQLIETYKISTLASTSKNKGDVTSEHIWQHDEKIGCGECTLPVADSLEGLSHDSLLTTKRRRGSWQFRPELCSSLSFDEAECLGSKATPAIDMGRDETTERLRHEAGFTNTTVTVIAITMARTMAGMRLKVRLSWNMSLATCTAIITRAQMLGIGPTEAFDHQRRILHDQQTRLPALGSFGLDRPGGRNLVTSPSPSTLQECCVISAGPTLLQAQIIDNGESAPPPSDSPIYLTEHDTSLCVRAKADCEVGDVVEDTSDADVRERRGLRNGRWGVCMESRVEPGNTSLLPAFVRL